MNVTFKLFATLMPYLPPGAVKNAVRLEVAESTTINQLINNHGVPESQVHLVLLNGKFIDPAGRDRAMVEGDALAIWPPVAGG